MLRTPTNVSDEETNNTDDDLVIDTEKIEDRSGPSTPRNQTIEPNEEVSSTVGALEPPPLPFDLTKPPPPIDFFLQSRTVQSSSQYADFTSGKVVQEEEEDEAESDEECPNFSIYSSESIKLAKSTDLSLLSSQNKETEPVSSQDNLVSSQSSNVSGEILSKKCQFSNQEEKLDCKSSNHDYNSSNKTYSPSSQTHSPSNQTYENWSQPYSSLSQAFSPYSQNYSISSQTFSPSSPSCNPSSQFHSPSSQSFYNPSSQDFNPISSPSSENIVSSQESTRNKSHLTSKPEGLYDPEDETSDLESNPNDDDNNKVESSDLYDPEEQTASDEEKQDLKSGEVSTSFDKKPKVKFTINQPKLIKKIHSEESNFQNEDIKYKYSANKRTSAKLELTPSKKKTEYVKPQPEGSKIQPKSYKAHLEASKAQSESSNRESELEDSNLLSERSVDDVRLNSKGATENQTEKSIKQSNDCISGLSTRSEDVNMQSSTIKIQFKNKNQVETDNFSSVITEDSLKVHELKSIHSEDIPLPSLNLLVEDTSNIPIPLESLPKNTSASHSEDINPENSATTIGLRAENPLFSNGRSTISMMTSMITRENNSLGTVSVLRKVPSAVFKVNKQGHSTGGLYSDSEDESVVKINRSKPFGIGDIRSMTEDISEEERSYTPCLDEREDRDREGLDGLETEMISDEDRNDFDEAQEIKTASDGDALEINAKESELDFSKPDEFEEGEIIDKNGKRTIRKKSNVLKTNEGHGGEKISGIQKSSNEGITNIQSEIAGSESTFKKLSKSNKERNYRGDKERERSKSKVSVFFIFKDYFIRS